MMAMVITGVVGYVTEMLLLHGKGFQECRPASRAKSYEISPATAFCKWYNQWAELLMNQMKHCEGKSEGENRLRTGLVV